MQHSAEWYRGAIDVCDNTGQRIAAALYRKALAEAEAREAGEPGMAEQVAAAKADVEELRGEAVRLRGALTELLTDQLTGADEKDGDIVLSLKPGRNPILVRASFEALEAEDDVEWLSSYNARMKALGAIEALEDIAKDSGIDGGKAYFATVVYREFPDRLTTQIGVVEAADIMQRAAQLRQQAEAERLAEKADNGQE